MGRCPSHGDNVGYKPSIAALPVPGPFSARTMLSIRRLKGGGLLSLKSPTWCTAVCRGQGRETPLRPQIGDRKPRIPSLMAGPPRPLGPRKEPLTPSSTALGCLPIAPGPSHLPLPSRAPSQSRPPACPEPAANHSPECGVTGRGWAMETEGLPLPPLTARVGARDHPLIHPRDQGKDWWKG